MLTVTSENKVVKFGDEINTDFLNPPRFSKDGNTLFFTRNNLFDGKNRKRTKKGVGTSKII